MSLYRTSFFSYVRSDGLSQLSYIRNHGPEAVGAMFSGVPAPGSQEAARAAEEAALVEANRQVRMSE